ncbi:MAG: DNA mismatch repair endonuclease MutL [Nitrospirae bacterium]|nr:DNA mismatch repair endonuclease MutL [Nitrospirota bacterium]MBI3593328.1 DNA mismatch repair endonuclease MutL [Nitrospirota bacterium]
MSSRIKILSTSLINRIAAGEVVERPASIVKELVDNAIDANSAEIVIRVREGGKGFISVSDNGDGMTPEDANLAFERHATSKLSSEEDLDSIRSLGFRGEALPSIAAVSRIHLSTQSRESRGIELELVSGKMTFKREMGRAPGTEISVSELFENYPARKKFLRSASTELAQIVSVVNQLALAHFRICFELIHHDKRLFRLPGVESFKDRIYQIYGGEILEKLVSIQDGDHSEFGMEGYVTLPPHTYPNRSMQELFINHRPIRNQVIHHAVYEAFSSHLMKGQHPAFFLLLEMDPSRVDVNVHPSKKEVRFPDSSLIHQSVYKRVKRSLVQGAFSSQSNEPVYKEIAGMISPDRMTAFEIKEGKNEYIIRSGIKPLPESETDPDLFRNKDLIHEPCFKVLGQFRSMFLLIQSGDELLIIDQHAAHERILFEKYRSLSENDDKQTESLLIPLTFEMTLKDLLVLKEYQPLFTETGIELDFYGENTVVVRSLPQFLLKADMRSLLTQLTEEIVLFQGFSSDKAKRDSILATIACHAAIKAGQSLENAEIAALFTGISRLENPSTCPHGRPITRHLGLTELEKMFCRI